MIAAVCVGEDGAMCFNHRRVSRDREQQADLLRLCAGRKLWIAPFSEKLFAGEAEPLVDEDFLTLAEPGDLCFVEDRPLSPVLDRVETLVIYRWNVSYPADLRLDVDLGGFTLRESLDFPGSSHEKITREIYERRN